MPTLPPAAGLGGCDEMVTPLLLPEAIGFEEFDLAPVRTRDTAAMEGRRTETAESGTPYWRLRASTQYLEDEPYDEMDAWLMDASDGGQCFLAHDIFRPRPRAYGDVPLTGTRAGGGAFDGTAILDTVTSARQVTISGLPEGFVINRGCNIGFRRSAAVRSLHRVTEAAAADSLGVAVVKFRFGLDPLFVPTGTVVDFEKPACVMQMDPDFTAPKGWSSRRVTFNAIEVFFS